MIKFWTQEEEAEKLRLRFENLKKTTGKGQAEFAREYKVPGGPSLLSQHVLNRRPINLQAAIAYADGFKCRIEEISPRLGLISDAANSVQAAKDAENVKQPWSPKIEPEHLEVLSKELTQEERSSYSPEALALAWLLDQVKDRLDKKSAETEASAVILRYVNKIGAAPTHKPGEH